MSNEWDGFLFPKSGIRKKRKKHGKSILQPKEDKRCYLCMLLYGDYREKTVQEHHIIFGRGNRAISEELGLKVNLCTERHHEHGREAVHNNHEMARILQEEAQKKFEEIYTHEEWMQRIGRNYIGGNDERDKADRGTEAADHGPCGTGV